MNHDELKAIRARDALWRGPDESLRRNPLGGYLNQELMDRRNLLGYVDDLQKRLEAAEQDTERLDWVLEWLGFNDDVQKMPVRDWTDLSDARAAIDAAREGA